MSSPSFAATAPRNLDSTSPAARGVAQRAPPLAARATTEGFLYPDFSRPLEELPDPLEIPPLHVAGRRPFAAHLRPPGSRSLTNRALLLAALADGRSLLRHALLEADDAECMLRAVSQLGAGLERLPEGNIAITGVGGRWRTPQGSITLDLGHSGTATRFLAAAALLSDVPIIIDGSSRMRERPIGQLIDALKTLGARAEYLGTPGCPPVRVFPPPVMAPAPRLELSTTLSSQFISGLLLIAPFIPGGLTLQLHGDVTSSTYVRMTLGVLENVGAGVRTSGDLRIIRVMPPTPPGPSSGLQAFTMDIEPDASSAMYFWSAAALIPGAACTIEGVGASSLQPDAAFPEILEHMGATVQRDDQHPSITVRGSEHLESIAADMSPMPDAAMTVAALACFARGPSIIRGVRTLRHKESDRIRAMQCELAKIGVEVESDVPGEHESLVITPPAGGVDTSPNALPVEFDTYGDHRMAMSLALIGLRRPNVLVSNPACVAKTHPLFWKHLGQLYETPPGHS